MISRTELPEFKKRFDVVSVFIEHDGEILLLHRQDSKPQGNTWAIVAGKVDEGEEFADAIVREVKEEIGIDIERADLNFHESYFVRYDDYDFTYHVFHLPVSSKPELVISEAEHKDHAWKTPQDALLMDLIQDEDSCIKWFYGIE